jgi:hypothetical protein
MQLEKECSTAIHSYLDILKEGCALLEGVQEIPISENQRNLIFSQRRQELLAQTAYIRARRRLWDFLNNAQARGHEV